MNLRKLMIAAMTVLVTMVSTPAFSAQTEFTLVSSPYTGWEPWAFADQSGILKKHADLNGITVKYERMQLYIQSITRFQNREIDAVTATNMDTIMQPALAGVDTEALLVGDFSNGNDGVVSVNIKTLCDIKGRDVYLVELSVSHYLLAKGLETCGLTERDISLQPVQDEKVLPSMLMKYPDAAIVTWNPLLLEALNVPGATNLFNSSQIPGEIIDMTIVASDAPDAFKRVLTGAWYEALAVMSSRGKASKEALEIMADVAGSTVPQFKAQLRTTAMMYNPQDAVDFVRSPALKETMDDVRNFLFDHGIYGENAPSADVVGIQFDDGEVMGDSNNIMLRFPATYMEKAAKGEL